MKIVKKEDNKEYKQDIVKSKNATLSRLEDFINSPMYDEFFGRLLESVIQNYTNNILTSNTKETHEIKFSEKALNIQIRKVLIQLQKSPLNTLRWLEKSIEWFLNTQ